MLFFDKIYKNCHNVAVGTYPDLINDKQMCFAKIPVP